MPTLRSPAATVVISAGFMAISPAANACVLLGCLVEKITNGPEDPPPTPPASIGQAPIAADGATRRAAAAEKAKPVRREAARDTARAAPGRLAMPRPAAEPRVSTEGQARREREADIRAAITQHGRAGVADTTEQASGTDGERRASGPAAPDMLRRLDGAPPPIALPAEADAAAPSPASSAAASLPLDTPVAESASGEALAAGRMLALIFPALGGALSAVVVATALRRILGLSGRTHIDDDDDASLTVPEQI